MDRLLDAGRAFLFGYFFGLGLLALLHYAVDVPATFDEAALLALVSGAFALLTNVLRRRSSLGR